MQAKKTTLNENLFNKKVNFNVEKSWNRKYLDAHIGVYLRIF